MGKEYKFSLEGTDIVIERCGKKFVVQIAKDTPYITKVVSYGKIPRQTHLIPFLSYQDILKNVSEFIYYEWDVQPGEKRVPTWIKSHVAKMINRRLYEKWQEVINRLVPKDFIDYCRRVFAVLGPKNFAATNTISVQLRLLDVYALISNPENHYFKKDFYKYRACVHAYFNYSPPLTPDWLSQFEHNNKAKRITLMNLPGKIPSFLIDTLTYIPLERPITDRIHLLATLFAYHKYAEIHRLQTINRSRIFERANRKEIYAAFEILKEGNRGVFGELSFARANHLNTIVSYICDYPEEYNGNLIGLTRRSLAYHHEIYNNHIRNLASYENHPPDTKTAVPPFQVEIPGCEIIFLDTVKAIIEEGAKMLHCVGSYTSSAVAGACFLYHVKYKDSEATLQIGKDGRVIQCYGPQNQKNDASRKVLTKKKICLESPG